MSADVSDARKQEYLRRASGAARARNMTGFLDACRKAETSAYGVLAALQASEGLLPEERANLATVAREMDCYRGKHGCLPHEQPTARAGRRWFRLR